MNTRQKGLYMSETKILIPRDTVVKLKEIATRFSELNSGAVGNEFWIASGTAGGGYDWEQSDIGVNKQGQLILSRQSGCSCNGPEAPAADTEYDLNNERIEYDSDSYDNSDQGAVTELIKTTDTLHDVLNGKSVAINDIIALPNAEIRRAVVELVGYDKIADEAEQIDSTEADGDLMRIKLPEDEDLMLLHVKDPSTDREYFLRVPPKIKTAREARAWTFGFKAEDFVMEQER